MQINLTKFELGAIADSLDDSIQMLRIEKALKREADFLAEILRKVQDAYEAA